MRWRKTQDLDLTENGREASGRVSVRGDELPLVSSPPPRLSSPTQASSSPSSSSSLSSTPLTSLRDDVPQAPFPRSDVPGASPLTSTTRMDTQGTTSTTSTARTPEVISITYTPRRDVPSATSSTSTPRRDATSATSSTSTPRRDATSATSSTSTPRRDAPSTTSSTSTPRRDATSTTSSTNTPRRDATSATSSTSTPRRDATSATSHAAFLASSLHDVPHTLASTPKKNMPAGVRCPAVYSTGVEEDLSFNSKSPMRVEMASLDTLRTGSSPNRHKSAAPVPGSVEGASLQLAATVSVASSPHSRASSSHQPRPGAHSATTSPQKVPVSPQPILAGLHIPISPYKMPVSPQKLPVSPQKLPVSPQKVPVSPHKMPISHQKNLPVTPYKIPVSPQNIMPVILPKTASAAPQKTTINSQSAPNSEQITVISLQKESVTSPLKTAMSAPTTPSRSPCALSSSQAWRPASHTTAFGTPPLPDRGSGGVVVVVNGGPVTDSSPRHLEDGQVRSPRQHSVISTTIPVGDIASFSENESREAGKGEQNQAWGQQVGKKTRSPASRKSSSKSIVHGEPKRNTHEKSKSVTIVVNDQQVTYSNTPNTYTTANDLQHPHANGITNGDLNHHLPKTADDINEGERVMVNGHTVAKGDGDTTRPASAASLPGSTKVDPDIQVRPLVGWWGEASCSGGSVVEDPASSDDCHRSTLTLVHSPARTYLSGETGDTVGGEDSGEAWSGVVSGVCGVVLIVGAASLLRLPCLLYEYGAGSFLAAWCAVLVVIAAPLAYLEACLSQFSSSAALAVWRLIPIARGVGWSTVVVCFYWAVVVLGYVAPVIHYTLLWINSALLQKAVSPLCSDSINNYTNTGDWSVDYHRLCVYELPDEWQSGVELTFVWPLPAVMAATVLTTSIIAACGAHTLAGITGAMAILAVIGLSLQLGIGLTEMYGRDMQSLWELARPFLTPQGGTLLQPRVWCAALAHVLLSLGLGVGLLMNFSSRGSFRFTLRRHVWGLVVLLGVVTALVSVVTVLQLTLLASDRGLGVSQALASIRYEYNGTTAGDNFLEMIDENAIGVSVGTAVITASHLMAVVTFPIVWLKQVVSTIIFTGLWCSGVTTGTVCIHTLIAALRDARDCLPRATAALILAPLLLAAATPSVTKGGAAVVALLDGDVLTLVVLWPPFTLTLAITIIYGIHKVRKDFTFMLEATVSLLWIPLWGVFIPLTLLGIVIWACIMDGQAVAVTDGPGWRTALVWGLRVLVLLPVPITAIYVVKSQLAYGVVDKVASSLQSSREWGDWGPQDPIEHHNWRRWREDETRPITSLKRRFANRPLTYTHSTLSSESSSTLTRLRNKYQRNGTASIL
ncbi:uncharacterized protein [Procambarus clarkii]|uniref:uncharacterized protein isoform X2 n=1 Tax=Procambarus clarkii TaxID=6728 RepID=UPI001E675890|nr:uncharacterized protein LOC123767583 isoform X2 [Procambarus clarkii]